MQQQDTATPEPSQADPSFLLVFLSVFALGSSSGMLFFGWLAFDYRSRYLGLLRDSMETDNSWLRDPLDSRETADREAAGFSADSENPGGSPDAEDENIVFEDSAWRDLGANPEEPLDDWLNEDNGRRPKSRRRGKA
jgi:hypothetical protein